MKRIGIVTAGWFLFNNLVSGLGGNGDGRLIDAAVFAFGMSLREC